MFLVNFVVLKGGLWQLAIYLLYDDLASGQVQVVTASSAITACDPWKTRIFGMENQQTYLFKVDMDVFFLGVLCVIFPTIFLKMTYFCFYRFGKNPTIKSLPKKRGIFFLKWLRRLSRKTDYLDSAGPISSPNPARFWGDSPEMVVTSKGNFLHPRHMP